MDLPAIEACGRSNAEPARGAAPAEWSAPGVPMTAVVTAPLTGGKAGFYGNK